MDSRKISEVVSPEVRQEGISMVSFWSHGLVVLTTGFKLYVNFGFEESRVVITDGSGLASRAS